MIICDAFQSSLRRFVIIHADRVSNHQHARQIRIVRCAWIFQRGDLHAFHDKTLTVLLSLQGCFPKTVRQLRGLNRLFLKLLRLWNRCCLGDLGLFVSINRESGFPDIRLWVVFGCFQQLKSLSREIDFKHISRRAVQSRWNFGRMNGQSKSRSQRRMN